MGRESGPSRGPTAPWTRLPLWPVRAGPGPGAVPAACSLPPARRASGGRARAQPALDRHFPPLLSAQPAPGGSGSASARGAPGVSCRGTREPPLARRPPAEGSGKEGPLSECGTRRGDPHLGLACGWRRWPTRSFAPVWSVRARCWGGTAGLEEVTHRPPLPCKGWK